VTLGTSFHRYTRSFAVPFLSRLAPSQGLVALRQTLVRRCHGGWGSSGKSEHEPEGQSVFEGLKFSGAGGVFWTPELTSDVQRQTDIAMTYEAGRP
jgi:hypothetical protein